MQKITDLLTFTGEVLHGKFNVNKLLVKCKKEKMGQRI